MIKLFVLNHKTENLEKWRQTTHNFCAKCDVLGCPYSNQMEYGSSKKFQNTKAFIIAYF